MSYEFNADALRPLYKPWEEPSRHRTPNVLDGQPALIDPGRRASRCLLVPRIRHDVEMWRHGGYAGASETSRTLLLHWFDTAHTNDFRYHYCQREAIESVIWLYEVAGYRNLSSMYGSLFGDEAEDAILKAITPEQDAWARYCAKIATGGGKTKVMSLAAVWSYFHSLFEPDSGLARHFVIIAPNLIVFERLCDDFVAGRAGPGSVFDRDPLVPPEWRDDFDLRVVLQDEAGGDTSRGTLYLSNIHRLYDRAAGESTGGVTYPAWSSPPVKKAQALKTGEALRRRIALHPRIIVLNDESHHLHDPGSAWNEALVTLDKQSRANGNAGICAQLDFSATPKHNDGTLFRHIVCDFPLGEAVDAGIVKVPVLGKSDALTRQIGDTAPQKWRVHLKLGYHQYEHAYDEWSKVRKPILFVMTENTEAANEITSYLNDNDDFPLLRKRVLNLHTKLKGKIKQITRGGRKVPVFVEDEKHLSDEDLKVIRQFSRDLDSSDSPYRCVVSVLMLREGWDVKNVTTIVPLRPYSADSNILAEQTLGRGLRRMFSASPDAAPERVTCVEHPAFVKLYEQELAEEGLPIGTEVIDGPKPISTTIFVDRSKPVEQLEIEVPGVSDSVRTVAVLEELSFEEVRAYFRKRYHLLPVKEKSLASVVFEERALFTDELVASWKIDRGLLSSGYTALSVYVQELEKACRLQNSHKVLAPLVQRFIEEVLFERPVSVYDGSIDHRMGDPDVLAHIRATFTPLIRDRTVLSVERTREGSSIRLSAWKEYQASHTPQRPCVPCARTMFNLVPCNRDLEAQFADFCDEADDVAAFAKNAGPQKLMIDYLSVSGRPALYWPDFFVRLTNGENLLIEMKGQEDSAVPRKARAAVEWCKSASTKERPWRYVFVPQAAFEANNEFSMSSLARACEPRLRSLLDTLSSGQEELPFEATPEVVRQERTDRALDAAGVSGLPPDIVTYVTQAVSQLEYDRKKHHPQLGMAFQGLFYPIEKLCGDILNRCLGPRVPVGSQDRRYYFEPCLDGLPPPTRNELSRHQRGLQKNLVHGANFNRVGTLLFCLRFAGTSKDRIGFVWDDVQEVFCQPTFDGLYSKLDSISKFRGRYVAHGDELLTDGDAAQRAMSEWIAGIAALHEVAQNPAS